MRLCSLIAVDLITLWDCLSPRPGGRTTYSHVGQGLGFLAVNRLFPSEHAALAVLTNDSSASTFSHIADRIEDLAKRGRSSKSTLLLHRVSTK